MKSRNLVFLLLLALLSPAPAHADKSILRDNCIEKNAPRARTALATQIITTSCAALHDPYGFKDYLSEHTDFMNVLIDVDNARYHLQRKDNEKWVEITQDQHDKLRTLFVRHRAGKHLKARCILSAKNLYKAKTDSEAEKILQKLDCPALSAL